MQNIDVLRALGVLTFWVLIPLVPAILLFKLLPDNKVNLSGPLSGPLGSLKINASGAIAAYFAVLVSLAFFIVSINRDMAPKDRPERQYWKLVGKIEMRDIDNKSHPFKGVEHGRIHVTTDPEIWRLDDVAELEVKMVRVEDEPVFRVTIDRFGYGIIKIKKDSPELTFDDNNNIIRIKQPLRIDQDTSATRVDGHPDAARGDSDGM
jgi:hypothetical protein